jgi:uncharacterized protein YoxC
MTVEHLLLSLGGVSISFIGYFLREALSALKEVRKESIEMNKKIAVIETESVLNNKHIEDKFDTLQQAIKDLTISIKDLNIEMKKKS